MLQYLGILQAVLTGQLLVEVQKIYSILVEKLVSVIGTLLKGQDWTLCILEYMLNLLLMHNALLGNSLLEGI